MKTLKLIAIASIAFLFACCKATQPTGPPSGEAPSIMEVNSILDTTENVFIAYAQQTNGNPYQAMVQTAAWLEAQPNVAAVVCDDSVYINIALKSGLETLFYFEQVDANGKDVFRGGGENVLRSGDQNTNGNPSVEMAAPDPIREFDKPVLSEGMPATHAITNKNVLIFASDTTSLQLTGQLKYAANLISNSGLGLNLTTLVNQQCTYEAVATFGNYGLVILDTHGQRDGFLAGSTLSIPVRPATETAMKALVISQSSADAYSQLVAGNISLGLNVKANLGDPQWQIKKYPDSLRTIWITSKYLSTLPAMSGTVIFGNMCYSGYAKVNPDMGTPMRTAFLNMNPISYYGYVVGPSGAVLSFSVDDEFARQMEDSLLTRLLVNQDSTGIAHLMSDNQTEFFSAYVKQHKNFSLFLRHFGSDNYSYGTCIDSFTDARDGQVYKAVCIGNQTWMAQNLNYNAPGSILYRNDPANGPIYGRLYDWNTVMQGAPPSAASPSGVQGICPKGWHVPSLAEYQTLVNTLGGNVVAGGAMKSTSYWQSPNTGATNSSGFSAVPGGYYAPALDSIFNLGSICTFWTTYQDTANAYNGVFWGGTRVLENTWTNTAPGESLQTYGNSCRCVKDP